MENILKLYNILTVKVSAIKRSEPRLPSNLTETEEEKSDKGCESKSEIKVRNSEIKVRNLGNKLK